MTAATKTIHRCDCGHTHLDHAHTSGVCAYGYCADRCQKLQTEVQGQYPPSEIPTWPAFDRATGEWANVNAFAPVSA